MAHEPQRLTLLHYALILKKTAVSEYLIESGIALNMRDVRGRSLLFYAVYSRENSVLDLMLRAGVPITHTQEGLDTLITACKIGNLEGADMLLRYYSGDDALVRAIQQDEVGAVDVLLKRHYKLPADLQVRVQNSPKTKSLFRSACIHLVVTKSTNNLSRVGQNSVFADENLSNSIVCASTGWSLQNIELLRRNYRTQ
jgi:ankyrin repeat protein